MSVRLSVCLSLSLCTSTRALFIMISSPELICNPAINSSTAAPSLSVCLAVCLSDLLLFYYFFQCVVRQKSVLQRLLLNHSTVPNTRIRLHPSRLLVLFSVCLFVCLFFCLSVFLSVRLQLSVCLSVFLSFFRLSVSLPASVCHFVSLSVLFKIYYYIFISNNSMYVIYNIYIYIP